jgi:5-formyltetrahydrofolate cyclo-ligase
MTEYDVADAPSIDDLKRTIRHAAVARRDALAPADRAKAAEAIAAWPFPIAIKPGMVVSGFSSLKSEINPVPLMRKLADRSSRCRWWPAKAGR